MKTCEREKGCGVAMTCDFCGLGKKVVRFSSDTGVSLDVCDSCMPGEKVFARESVLPVPRSKSDLYGQSYNAERNAANGFVPPSAAPATREILPEDADDTFEVQRNQLDFDLDAAGVVERAGKPVNEQKLAAITLCRERLAAAAKPAELELVRNYAARMGLLAAGAELGFAIPMPQAETDLERQRRQREFEEATAPRPGTVVREGNGRPVLSAWGNGIDPRVLAE